MMLARVLYFSPSFLTLSAHDFSHMFGGRDGDALRHILAASLAVLEILQGSSEASGPIGSPAPVGVGRVQEGIVVQVGGGGAQAQGVVVVLLVVAVPIVVLVVVAVLRVDAVVAVVTATLKHGQLHGQLNGAVGGVMVVVIVEGGVGGGRGGAVGQGAAHVAQVLHPRGGGGAEDGRRGHARHHEKRKLRLIVEVELLARMRRMWRKWIWRVIRTRSGAEQEKGGDETLFLVKCPFNALGC